MNPTRSTTIKLVIAGVVALLLVVVALLPSRVDPRQQLLAQERNCELTFYGKVVDQDGNPLEAAVLEYHVESTDKRFNVDRSSDNKWFNITSDANGRFDIRVKGTMLRRLKAERPGYRHLYDKYSGSIRSGVVPSNELYLLMNWDLQVHKTDPENPSVLVFVKNGVREVSALSSRGGSDLRIGSGWHKNEPGWPIQPSLKDVVQISPEATDTN